MSFRSGSDIIGWAERPRTSGLKSGSAVGARRGSLHHHPLTTLCLSDSTGSGGVAADERFTAGEASAAVSTASAAPSSPGPSAPSTPSPGILLVENTNSPPNTHRALGALIASRALMVVWVSERVLLPPLPCNARLYCKIDSSQAGVRIILVRLGER